MAYTPYEWTVNSYLNPTRMNAIEQGIAAASQAAESASGEFHTIEELIGTQSIAGIGDGTLTGATWKINNDLTELSGVVTTLNSKITEFYQVTGTTGSTNAEVRVPVKSSTAVAVALLVKNKNNGAWYQLSNGSDFGFYCNGANLRVTSKNDAYSGQEFKAIITDLK